MAQYNDVATRVVSRSVLLDPRDPAAVPYTASPQSQADADQTVLATITVAVAMILLQIALLADPALAVGARRSERTLAIVASTGGNAATTGGSCSQAPSWWASWRPGSGLERGPAPPWSNGCGHASTDEPER